jgi:23S rRNA pseudouridine2605 synthase
MSTERLQKILAGAGVASRRAAEQLITEGRVRVNGRIVRELGSRANPERDRVEVDGRRLVAERPVYYLMHKPRGVVTTLDDPEGRQSVKDLLRGISERVFPVGRLDFHTSGVLLLTNDGDLAQALLHPTRAVPKTYSAKLQGHVDERGLEMLRSGVVLDDGEKTAPATVHLMRSDEAKHTLLEITIAEGKNRQIHRMAEAINRPVMRLTRIAFAGLTIDGLRAGQMRPLKPLELSELKQKYMHTNKIGYGRGAMARSEVLEVDAGGPAEPQERGARGRRDAGGASVRRQSSRSDAADPRRDAAGPRRDAAGPRRDVVGPRRDAAGPRRDAAGPRRDAVEPQPYAVEPTRRGRKGARPPRRTTDAQQPTPQRTSTGGQRTRRGRTR